MKKYKYYEQKVKIRQLDGSYKTVSVYGKTPRELGEKIKRKETDAEAAYQRSLRPPFSDVSERWFEHHRNEVSENTAECYVAPLKDLQAAFGAFSLEEITPLMVQQFLDQMAAQGFAKQTIKLRRIALNLVYNYAQLNGITAANPTLPVKVPKKAKTTKRLLPDQWEIDKALEPGSLLLPLGMYFPFLYLTGCRKCEALAIDIDKDIDFQNDIIHINKKIIFVGNRPVLKAGSKTENGVRSVPLLAPLKAMLRGRHGLLFPDQNGGYIHKSHFDKWLDKYKEATGIRSTGHQFRHAFATICYDAGLEDLDMADIVGHADAETTKKIYVHIKEQRRKSFTDKLNRAISIQ